MSQENREQIIALGRLGWSLRRIEKATGVRRETVSQYLRGAGVPIRPPRARYWPKPSPSDGQEAKPASSSMVSIGAKSAQMGPEKRFEGPAPPPKPASESPGPKGLPARSPRASACEPYRELILARLEMGRNAMAIWQDLVVEHGFSHQYASVRRFIVALEGSGKKEPCGIIQTEAGEEAQVDYGSGPMVRDAQTGKYRRCRLFVMTLGCSRKSVRLLVWKSSSKVWCQLHETAFRRLGGVTRTLVLDNLKEGIVRPDVYDPTVNPLYRDFLRHYGVVALPCRVRDPDRKGKVESGVGHAKRTPLRGLRFESLQEAQTYLDGWEERFADTRIHGTTKKKVSVMFAEEKPHLLPLPIEPFRYYDYGTRTVHLDGCVEVQRAYYRCVPPARVGQLVCVQWDGRVVRILCPKTGLLFREYMRQEPGGYRMSEEERRRPSQKADQLLARARFAGTNVGAVASAIHRTDGEIGLRRILGLLALCRKHGKVVADEACKVALEVGVPSYRLVRRLLEHKTQLHLTLRQVDPLIRELTHYRDVVRRMTHAEETK